MSRVGRPLVALVALYAGMATADRFTEAGIAWWVYGLAATMLAAALLAGARRDPPAVAVAAAGAAGCFGLAAAVAAGIAGRPFDLDLTVIEAAFVVAVASLAAHLAAELRALDDALGSAVSGRNPVLPLDGAEAARRILDEVSRSRRYGRPLSVTVFAPDDAAFDAAVAHAAPEVRRAIHSRYVRGRIARVIAGQLRRSDLLLEDGGSGRFVILTPETDESGSALLAERIRRASRATGLHVQAASASFSPDSGFEQVVRTAERRLDGAGAATPHLRPVESASAD